MIIPIGAIVLGNIFGDDVASTESASQASSGEATAPKSPGSPSSPRNLSPLQNPNRSPSHNYLGNYPLTVGNVPVYASNRGLQYSTFGAFYVWRSNVPRINDKLLDSVIYLYQTAEDADVGKRAGGTGFLVLVDSEVHADIGYMYAVTNSHVIREGKSPVIRLNSKEGEKRVINVDQGSWMHHQDGDDVAVCHLWVREDVFRISTIPMSMFVTHDLIQKHDLGPGDETFMIGRFIGLEGRQRNTPTVRFGNVSMMQEPVLHPNRGILQESFLVEMRSLPGYSGSPVFLHMLPYSKRPNTEGYLSEGGPWLLGIDWSHIADREKVLEKNEQTGKWEPIEQGWEVRANSGQMAVVPAWRLQELLFQEEMVLARRRGDEEITQAKESSAAVLDVQTGDTKKAGQHDPEPNTFTESEFEDALDKVSRREPPPDPES